MSEYDQGWKQCALFLCEVLGERVKKWRDWDSVLSNAIADDYQSMIEHIKEKHVENHK
jgi:hypothetical protein